MWSSECWEMATEQLEAQREQESERERQGKEK